MGWRGREGLHGDQDARMKRKGRLARSWTHKALAEATDPANTSSPTKGRGGAQCMVITHYSPLPRPSYKH